MKKLARLIIPVSLFAVANSCAAFTPEEVDAISNPLQMYVFASVVIIAVVTNVVVFNAARRMKGGVFGTALNYFGIGMATVLVGFVVNNIFSTTTQQVVQILTNALFIVGYIAMAFAATKLSNAIKGN
jgi:hypothetical protein